jgi:hypothetical protein
VLARLQANLDPAAGGTRGLGTAAAELKARLAGLGSHAGLAGTALSALGPRGLVAAVGSARSSRRPPFGPRLIAIADQAQAMKNSLQLVLAGRDGFWRRAICRVRARSVSSGCCRGGRSGWRSWRWR